MDTKQTVFDRAICQVLRLVQPLSSGSATHSSPPPCADVVAMVTVEPRETQTPEKHDRRLASSRNRSLLITSPAFGHVVERALKFDGPQPVVLRSGIEWEDRRVQLGFNRNGERVGQIVRSKQPLAKPCQKYPTFASSDFGRICVSSPLVGTFQKQVFLRQHLTGAKVSPIWSERAGRNQEVIETAERAASRGHAGCYRTGQPCGIYRTVLSRRSA